VDERAQVITGARLVALAGGMMALLVLTDRGQSTLRRVGPALDNVSRTLQEVRSIIRKIDDVVQETQAAVTDVRAALSSTRISDDSQGSPYGI